MILGKRHRKTIAFTHSSKGDRKVWFLDWGEVKGRKSANSLLGARTCQIDKSG